MSSALAEPTARATTDNAIGAFVMIVERNLGRGGNDRECVAAGGVSDTTVKASLREEWPNLAALSEVGGHQA